MFMGSIDSGQLSKKNEHTLDLGSLCKALVMGFFTKDGLPGIVASTVNNPGRCEISR